MALRTAMKIALFDTIDAVLSDMKRTPAIKVRATGINIQTETSDGEYR